MDTTALAEQLLDEDVTAKADLAEVNALKALDEDRPTRKSKRRGATPMVCRNPVGSGPVAPTLKRGLPEVPAPSTEFVRWLGQFEHDEFALEAPANARVVLADGRLVVGRVLAADAQQVHFRAFVPWTLNAPVEVWPRSRVVRAASVSLTVESRFRVEAVQARGDWLPATPPF